MTKYWLIAIVAVLVVLFISVLGLERSRINETPKYELSTNDEEFNLPFVCSRIYDLDLVMEIQPPLGVKKIIEANNLVSGVLELKLMKDGKVGRTGRINLNSAANYYSGGLWKKVIYKVGSRFSSACKYDFVNVRIEDLNVDLKKHRVFIYFSRDPRV